MDRTRKTALFALAGVLALAVAWALLAPEERSLGERIRTVYLHASATWAGLIVMNLTGLVGILAFAGRAGRLEGWLPRAWLAGLILFAGGFALSLLAARQSWGAVYWAEPRVRASVAGIVLALLVHHGGRTLTGRWRHLLWIGASVLITVVVRVATLVLHPRQPIQDETPLSIKLTFYGLAGLMLIAAACVAVALPEPAEAAEAVAEPA